MTRPWLFVTFGGGMYRWRRAAQRIAREVSPASPSLETLVATERSLPTSFRTEHADILRSGRGYGYWIWKPYLLLRALDQSRPRGVVYLDAGSTVNLSTPEARKRWADYVEHAEDVGGTFFQMDLTEEAWTKPELLEHLALDEPDRRSGQIMGGHLFLHNRRDARELLQQWYAMCCLRAYCFLDDSRWDPELAPGPFVEHRHDQSILSCLIKANGQPGAIPDETFFHPNWFTEGLRFPIWGTRFASGRSYAVDRKGTYLERAGTGFRLLKERLARS